MFRVARIFKQCIVISITQIVHSTRNNDMNKEQNMNKMTLLEAKKIVQLVVYGSGKYSNEEFETATEIYSKHLNEKTSLKDL